jgi:hypothetical protein
VDRSPIDRRGHPADNRVQDLLNSLILKGGPAEDWVNLIVDYAVTDDGMDLLFGDGVGIFQNLC